MRQRAEARSLLKPQTACAKCPNRDLAPLSNAAIYRHLSGKDPLSRDVVGLYPTPRNETFCLLALDFNGEGWR